MSLKYNQLCIIICVSSNQQISSILFQCLKSFLYSGSIYFFIINLMEKNQFPYDVGLKIFKMKTYYELQLKAIFFIYKYFIIFKNLKKKMVQQDRNSLKQTSNPLQDFIIGKHNFINREQTNNISFFFKVLSKVLFLFHILITQQIKSKQDCNQFFSNLLQQFSGGSLLILIFQIWSILLKLIIIEAVYFNGISSYKIIGLQSLNKKVLQSFSIFIEVDITLSAYLLLFNWQQNIFLFLCSFIINIINMVYMQNYLIRKDITYISSTFQNIVFQSFIFVSYAVNAFFINFGTYQSFCLSLTSIGIIIFIWFFKWGRHIYFRGFYKDMPKFMLSIYFSLIIVIFHNMIENMPILAMEQISKFVITFLVIFGLIKITDRKKIKKSKNNLKGRMKSYELYILNILQKSFDNAEYESLYFGYINFHAQEECMINCPLFEEQIIGPNNQHKKMANQRESSFKCLMKCLYEHQIKFSESKQIILNYCEFLYNEMGNFYLMITYLERLGKFKLNIIDLVKISKLKLLAQQENKRLNSELYENKLNIEDIIEAQNSFKIIERDILSYLHNNEAIRCSFGENIVEVSQLKQKMAQNFELVDKISKKWKSVFKFFNCQKHWKYVYLNFQLFLKNQQIKLKHIDQMNILFSSKSIFHSQKIFFKENRDTNSLITQAIMFNSDSFCIRTKMEEDELIITQVSNNFYKSALYTKEEIKGCQLNILMPQQIRKSHSKTVVEWIQSGLISNDSSYNISFTNLLNKEQVSFPIVKYYKAYFNIQKGFEFICLLKINSKLSTLQENQMKTVKQITKFTKKQIQCVEKLNIHKQFKKEILQNNLSLQNNIFIKQQILQPAKNLKQIYLFKIFSRIFTFTIIISIIILSQITLNNTNNLINYGNQFINFVTMYRFPMVLAFNYLKSSLNVGNQTIVNNQIAFATSSMLASYKSTITMKTLFDPSLNVPSNYGPYYKYPDIQNLTYSQIDIFYSIVSDITSLTIQPVNLTGQTFRHFNSYLKPSYDTMMNSTKFQLHSTFLGIFQQIKMNQLQFLIAQSILFIIILAIIFYYISILIQKIKKIMSVLGDFNINDINKILSFWNLVDNSFRRIFKQSYISPKVNSKRYVSIKDISFLQQKENIVINKKAKEMLIGKRSQNELFRLRFYVIIPMVIIIILAVLIEIQMIITISKLQNFEQSGFSSLKYFPAGAIFGLGCMEKYYSLLYPQQILFNPDRFSDVMSTMQLFGNFNYIGQKVDESSPYYQKQKNYFFGNPCTYNPTVLKSLRISEYKCQNIINGSFKQGLSAAYRFTKQIGQDYMRGNIILTSEDLDELTLSVSVVAAYVLDIIMTWLKQFQSRIIAQQQFTAIFSIIIASIIFVIHLIINEYLISGRIKKEFEFVCKMYESYVPEFILLNEKVIKQKFVLEGLIVKE